MDGRAPFTRVRSSSSSSDGRGTTCRLASCFFFAFSRSPAFSPAACSVACNSGIWFFFDLTIIRPELVTAGKGSSAGGAAVDGVAGGDIEW